MLGRDKGRRRFTEGEDQGGTAGMLYMSSSHARHVSKDTQPLNQELRGASHQGATEAKDRGLGRVLSGLGRRLGPAYVAGER
jgi:hypothetical protein